MVKKPAQTISTVNGLVTVDPEASYRLTLAKAITVSVGHIIRPTDQRVELTGAALLAIAASAEEGAIVDAAAQV